MNLRQLVWLVWLRWNRFPEVLPTENRLQHNNGCGAPPRTLQLRNDLALYYLRDCLLSIATTCAYILPQINSISDVPRLDSSLPNTSCQYCTATPSIALFYDYSPAFSAALRMAYRTIRLYYPEGVDKVIGFGSSSFIGVIDEKTVLKYPRVMGEQWEKFIVEQQIYNAIGSHPRILACYGLDERGLKLEYARKGTVRNLLRNPDHARSLTDRDRIKLCRQAAEGIAYIHTKNVIHCDISTRNFLLDEKLDVKLSDFQGIYIDSKGVVWNGHALENVKSFLPRQSALSDKTSDLFALGSAIYEIILGHEPFPELDELDDEEEIERRYLDRRFPSLDGVLGGDIIYKCWSLVYDQVFTCAEELKVLENSLIL